MIKASPQHPVLTAYYQAEEALMLKRESLETIRRSISFLEEDLRNLALPGGMVARYEPVGTQGGVLYSDTTFDAMQRLRASNEDKLVQKKEAERLLLDDIERTEEALFPYRFAVQRLDEQTRNTLAVRFSSTYSSNRAAGKQAYCDEKSVRNCLDKAEEAVKIHVAQMRRPDLLAMLN